MSALAHNAILNNINLGIDYGIASTIITALSKDIGSDIYRGELNVEGTMGKYDVAEHIRKFWPKSVVSTLLRTEYYVWIYDDEQHLKAFVNVIDNSDKEKHTSMMIDSPQFRKFQVDVYSVRQFVTDFMTRIDDLYPIEKLPKLQWHYLSEGRRQVKEMPLKDENVIYDEYYPFIKQGVNNFITEFMASKAPVMLLIGDPGTGKTSLLRHMITKLNIHAAFTYEQELYKDDRFFMSCLVDSDTDMLILEDSDALLVDREAEGNKVMSKLLNVSDGTTTAIDLLSGDTLMVVCVFQRYSRI